MERSEKQMCRNEEDCNYECHGEWNEDHHEEHGHHGHRMGFGFLLMSIEEEVKTLEEMKGTLEKRLEIVNKRLEVLKR